jgi:hypothetical protein
MAIMAKKRGNPNWTNPAAYAPQPAGVTSFDAMTRTLRLTPPEFESSVALKEWVLKNKDQKYVPLDLLLAWKLVAT